MSLKAGTKDWLWDVGWCRGRLEREYVLTPDRVLVAAAAAGRGRLSTARTRGEGIGPGCRLGAWPQLGCRSSLDSRSSPG